MTELSIATYFPCEPIPTGGYPEIDWSQAAWEADEVPVEPVPLAGLLATQDWLQTGQLAHYVENGENTPGHPRWPFVLFTGEQGWICDGHHRAAAGIIRSATWFYARVRYL